MHGAGPEKRSEKEYRPGIGMNDKRENARRGLYSLGLLAGVDHTLHGKAASPHAAVIEEHNKLASMRERSILADRNGLRCEEPAPGQSAADVPRDRNGSETAWPAGDRYEDARRFCVLLHGQCPEDGAALG